MTNITKCYTIEKTLEKIEEGVNIMKVCRKCGNHVSDFTFICPKCNYKFENDDYKINMFNERKRKRESFDKWIKGLMIAVTIINACLFLISLCWCVPMTMLLFDKINTGDRVSGAFKACIFFFVSPLVCFLLWAADY